MSAPLDRVGRARAASSSTELAALYAEWAESYDADVFGALGFIGSARIAELLAQHQSDRSLAVLDIGCGTGACGVALSAAGFTTLDGIDLSPEMLAIADATRRYRRLDTFDLTSGSPLPIAGYAASVSAGTFTTGHVGAEHLGPIVSAHAPGAVVAWVIADALWPSFERRLVELGATITSSDLEAVRADGPAESRMVVGRLGRSS